MRTTFLAGLIVLGASGSLFVGAIQAGLMPTQAADQKESEVSSASAASPQETLWVFAVGVSQYKDPSINLLYADHDAEALARTLQQRSKKIFRKINTKVLVNQQATRQTILREMRVFFDQAVPEDTAIIALMGSAIIEKGFYSFVPHSADLTNISTEGLSSADFKKEVTAIRKKVKRLILIIDTDHAGRLDISLSDLYILGSSMGEESSLEDSSYRLPGEKNGHGAFTFAILRGLRGEADRDRGGSVTVFELLAYVSELVPRMTADRQRPYFRIAGTDFPLATGVPLTEVQPAIPKGDKEMDAPPQSGITVPKSK